MKPKKTENPFAAVYAAAKEAVAASASAWRSFYHAIVAVATTPGAAKEARKALLSAGLAETTVNARMSAVNALIRVVRAEGARTARALLDQKGLLEIEAALSKAAPKVSGSGGGRRGATPVAERPEVERVRWVRARMARVLDTRVKPLGETAGIVGLPLIKEALHGVALLARKAVKDGKVFAMLAENAWKSANERKGSK